MRIQPGVGRLRRLRKGVITASRLIQDRVASAKGRRWRCAMLTLTYREDVEWQPRHVTGLLKCLREYAKRRGFILPYVWVMELTERGRPHYHVLVWMPPGQSLPKPDKQGWWKHGHTRIEWVRRAVGYAAKYASKGTTDGKAFPSGARIHGVGGLHLAERAERSWWLAPAWVRDYWTAWEYQPRPCKGGGWYSSLSGEWMPSPWRIHFEGGGVVAVWCGWDTGAGCAPDC